LGGRPIPTRHCDGMYDLKLEKLQERFRQTGEATPTAGLETGPGAPPRRAQREIEAAEQHRKRSHELRRNG
jgi:hypothetical protein